MITTFLQVQADTLSQVNPAELAKALPVNTEISVLEFIFKGGFFLIPIAPNKSLVVFCKTGIVFTAVSVTFAPTPSMLDFTRGIYFLDVDFTPEKLCFTLENPRFNVLSITFLFTYFACLRERVCLRE